MDGDKKLIYFLVALIIFFGVVLLIKIKTTPKYDPIIYDEIYNEYENIFGENEDIQENDYINTQESNNIIKQNNNQ